VRKHSPNKSADVPPETYEPPRLRKFRRSEVQQKGNQLTILRRNYPS
jgi:hypothetical protein